MSLRRITLPVLLIAVVTMTCGVSFATDDAHVTALKAAEAARFKANVDADATVLGQVLDDALEYDVRVWKDKRWQMTAWRSARMPAPAAAPAK